MSQGSFDFEEFYAHRAKVEAGERRLGKYDFGVGHPDPTFPVREIREAAIKVIDEDAKELVQYPVPMGLPLLRELIGKKVRSMEGTDINPDRIIITNGSMQGLCMMADTFINPGDTIITEEYTYPGALRAFRRHEPRILGTPLDEGGLIPEELRGLLEMLRKQGVKAKYIYTVASCQNPTGTVLSPRRREALIEVAEDYKVPIFEDDAYGDLIFDLPQPPSLYSLSRSDNVIRIGSFSKIIAAGIRLGWLIAPERAIPRFLATKVDGGINSLASRVVAEYLREYMEGRVKEVQERYRIKRDVMLRALEENLGHMATWSRPQGGLFLWLKLPEGLDVKHLDRYAVEEGVAYIPGRAFSPEGKGQEYIRLSYAYMSHEEIRTGIGLLARALRKAREGSY